MEQTLQLVFRNEGGSTFSIALANPRTNLTVGAVAAVMDLVIARNIFQSNGGALTVKERASRIAREVVEIASFQ
ncbi:MAG: DUF2922 domain-containing protein [Dethiobacter sp.]|nr:DUF2922 domain-containing protein [Dethiobacter sp.]MCL5980918.1 DUF2922 domain-containing protein [Bacillota bacterium]